MGNGVAPAFDAAIAEFRSSLGGPSSSELAAADAQAALANAIVESLVQVNGKGLREAIFLMEYLGYEDGQRFVAEVFRYKKHQIPGALKRLVEAIKALSLSEFMRGVNLNLGQK